MLIKKHDGFTLIEVIISIAILSVVSVVVLQLFMTSRNLNMESRRSDIGSVMSTNMIESVKTYDNPLTLVEDFTWLTMADHRIEGQQLYNTSFEPISDSGAFKMVCVLEEDLANPGLYALSVIFTDLETEEQLASYTTKHYFKHQEVAHD